MRMASEKLPEFQEFKDLFLRSDGESHWDPVIKWDSLLVEHPIKTEGAQATLSLRKHAGQAA